MVVLVVSLVVRIVYAANTVPILATRIHAQAPINNGFRRFGKKVLI